MHDLRMALSGDSGRIPVSRPSECSREAERTAHAPAGTATRGGSKSILVADDDEALRMLLQAILSADGYRVTMAQDGEEAVDLFKRQGPFELIILDLRMPKLSGQAALQRIRALDPSICVMALTGMPLEKASDPMLSGFDGQMTKPFHSEELVEKVKSLLAERKGH